MNDCDYERGEDEWEPDEQYFDDLWVEEMICRDADEQQAEDTRNGGDTIMDVVHVIEKHYGVRCGFAQTRNRAVVHLWSPPHQTVGAFHLCYDGQLWHVERADWHTQDVPADLEPVKRAVEESQGLPDKETTESGPASILSPPK